MLNRICGSRSYNKVVTKTNLILWKSKYNAYCLSTATKSSVKEPKQITSKTKKMFSKYYSNLMKSKSTMMSLRLAHQSLFSKAYILAGSRYFCTANKSVKDQNSKISGLMKDFANFNRQPDVMEISSIMNDLNRLTLSLEEFENYLPFVEEVADVANKNISNISNGSQALTFLRFYIQKGEINIDVWRSLNSAITNALEHSEIEEIVEIAEVLKSNDKLTENVANNICKQLKNKLEHANINQLPGAVLMLCTLEAHDDSFVAHVDKLLTGNVDAESDLKSAYKNVSQLTTESFSTICKVSHLHGHNFKNFMLAGKHFVEENIEKFTLLELSHVLIAFADSKDDYKILEKGSKIILQNAAKISITELFNFMQAYSVHGGNEDLWSIFDRIIGGKARILTQQQVFKALKFFASSNFKSTKLFMLLQFFVNDFDYTLAENCEIIRFYGEIEFNRDDIYNLMDKRLSSQILEMTETDFLNAMIGFSNPRMDKKFKIHENIEQHIKHITPKLSLKSANSLLHRFGTQRKGSKIVINALLDRVYDISTSAEEISAYDVFMTIHVFDLLGSPNQHFYPLLGRLREQVQSLDYERLSDCYEILYKRVEDEGFNTTIIALKREIETYETNGEKKTKQ